MTAIRPRARSEANARRRPPRGDADSVRGGIHPTPKVVPKPWGREVWWAQSKKYAGKFLVIEKGHRLSLQYHRVKHETIYTLRGRWRLVLGRRTSVQGPGSVTVIPPRAVHRFEAPYGRVTLIEVSSPELWDVVRLKDDYRRHHGSQAR